MPQLSAFLRPSSLEEALALLTEHGDCAKPLAGGTSLIFSKSSRVNTLVDLRGVGLDYAEVRDDGLHLGAMLSLTGLRRELSGAACPTALLEAAGKAGTRVLQNQISVGGNCMQAYSWSDLPVALLCLGASFGFRGPGGARAVAAEALFAKAPIRTLQDGELLVEVVVPTEGTAAGSAYQKFTRTDADHSICSVAARVVLDQSGAVSQARVAAGALRALPQLLGEVDEALVGKVPSEALLQEAGERAAKAARITADYRATAGYRQQLLAVMVADMLGEAVKRAGGAE
jgi:aerobic carbon-monoxide dehydrogenase medium subunit